MKNFISILLIAVFVATVGFIFSKETERRDHIPDFLLGKPKIGSIRVERRINGKIQPAEEIKVKSKINGVVENVYVEIGQKVKEGQKIAVIRKLLEPMEIEELKTSVNLHEIQMEMIRLSYDREKKLAESGLTSNVEFESITARYKEASEQLESARKRLQMATSGVTTTDRNLSNIIYAPASGTILSLISRPGSPVIKQNNYNEGTTLATIANMDSLKFYGNILEKDLMKISEGEKIQIETLHSNGKPIQGFIDKIYPKGNDENGIVKFPIEVSVNIGNVKLWGGMNATAIITIAKTDSALYVEEKYLTYKNDSCYATVQHPNNEYRQTLLQTGLSDGIKTEIYGGLSLGDKLALPEED